MEKIAVTVAEATVLSGIGRSSLYKLFNEGKLTPRKAGKRTLILVAELERYVKSLPAGVSLPSLGAAGERMPVIGPVVVADEGTATTSRVLP